MPGGGNREFGLFGAKATGKQTSEPWAAAQPALKYGLDEAERLYQQGTGFNPYQGNRVAGFGPTTLGAMSGILGYANAPTNLFSNAQNAVGDISSGTNRIQTGNLYSNLYNQSALNPNAGREFLTNVARGDFLGQGSPEWNQFLDYQMGALSDDINRGFSGLGRYGSGAHTATLAREIGQQRNAAMAQQQQQEEARQLAAVNAILQGDQAQFGNQLGALAGMSGVEGQNIANQMAAAGMTPEMWQAGLLPQMTAAGIGGAQDQLSQDQINAAMEAWNEGQMSEWQRLMAMNNIAQATGGQGGTATNFERNTPIRDAIGVITQFLPFL